MEFLRTVGNLLLGSVGYVLIGGIGVVSILRPERFLKTNPYYHRGGEMLRDLYVVTMRIAGALLVVFALDGLYSSLRE